MRPTKGDEIENDEQGGNMLLNELISLKQIMLEQVE